MNKKVSIIIRTIDNRYEFLEKTVFSLYCNDYPGKEAVIVYQGTNSEYFESLRNLQNYYPEMEFIFVQNKTNKDERSKNLNLGIQAATGRYIGFLDDDDYITQEHISSLIDKLDEENKAWGYSKDIECYYENNTYLARTAHLHYDGKFNFQKLLKGNYIPICSWMIDTAKADKSLLVFDETLKRLEDYVFILNLASKFEPAQSEKITSIYNLYLKSEHQSTTRKTLQEKSEWKKVKEQLDEIKKKLYDENYLLQPENENEKVFRIKGNIICNYRFKFEIFKVKK